MSFPVSLMAQDATFRDMRRDTSTRGVDFSVKLIGSPGGDVNLVGGSDYIRGAFGGEMTLGYRVNKAFTAGIGFDYVNAWNKADYGTGFTSLFAYMKVNFKERPKFTPYISLNFGFDVFSMLADDMSERGDIYVDDPCYFFIITPAGGLDFPLNPGGRPRLPPEAWGYGIRRGTLRLWSELSVSAVSGGGLYVLRRMAWSVPTVGSDAIAIRVVCYCT